MKKIALISFLLSSSLWAIDCPKDPNEVIKLINESGICYDAREIARQCATSAAEETEYAEAASDVCIVGFQSLMNAKEKSAYKVLINLCDKNASRATGIYYHALFNNCKLDVDVLMNSLYNTAQ